MKLTAVDRVVIRNILPQNDTIMVMTIAKDILDKVSFTQNEIAVLTKGGDTQISNDKIEAIEVSFSSVEVEVLKEAINKADKEKKVTLIALEVFKKIKEL